jgi:hypothetical protein
MTDTTDYKKESLTQEEIDTLEKDLKKAYLTGFIIGIMLSCIYLLIVFALLDGKCFLVVPLILFVTFIITIRTTRNRRKEIDDCFKEVRKYQIIDKISFWDDNPGFSGGPIMKYRLTSKYKRFSVSKELYERADVNDWVIEHETRLSKESLKIEILKNASIQQQV